MVSSPVRLGVRALRPISEPLHHVQRTLDPGHDIFGPLLALRRDDLLAFVSVFGKDGLEGLEDGALQGVPDDLEQLHRRELGARRGVQVHLDSVGQGSDLPLSLAHERSRVRCSCLGLRWTKR